MGISRKLTARVRAGFCLLFACALLPTTAFAQSLTIQGKVLDGSNNPVNGNATQFRVQVLSPDTQRCVLFDETHTVDLTNTNGLFTINLNDSTGTLNAPNSYTLEQALSNRAAFSVNSSYCASGSGTLTYTPGASDNRKVVIQFRDPGTMASFETIPEMDLNPVAWSMESRTVGGFAANSLLRVVAGGTPGTAPTLTTADVAELQSVIAGTSTKYLARDIAGGASIPSYAGNPASPSAGSMWFDATGSGSLKFKDASGAIQTLGSGGGSGTITGITAGGALTGGGTSGAVTISLPTTGVTGAGVAVGSASSVPVITYDSYGRLTAVTTAAISGTLPAGTAGQFLKSSGGSAWAGAGIIMGDLKNTDGSLPLFGTVNCSASQSMYWDSGADQIRCQNISLSNSQISDLAWGKLTGVPNLVANAGGTPSLLTDTEANLPTVHVNGRIFFASDTKKIFRDNGTTWDQLAVAPNAVLNALNTTSISTGPTASQPTGQVAGRLFINTATQKIQYDNGTAWIDVASNGGSGFTGSLGGEVSGTQSATQVDSINGISRSTITANLNAVTNATDAATLSTLVKRDTNGDFSGRKITANEMIVKGTSHTASLTADPTANYSLKLPDDKASVNGQVLTSDTNGVLSWASPSSSFGSISVSPPVTNTSGTIGMPSANTSRDGYLTQSDWNTFSGKLSSALNSALIWVGNGSNVATPVAPSGNVSVNNAGKFTVTGIRDQNISGAGTNVGQVLRYSATNTWAPEFLTMKDLRSTVTGTQALTSSCTADKTLYWDSATDSLGCQDISIAASTQISGQLPIANGGTGTNSAGQNLVFAGPSSGAGAPAFRALAASDLPAEAKLWAELSGNVFRASGNVGIGTSAPNYLLQANSSSANAILQLTNSTTGAASSNGMYLGQLGMTSYLVNQENGDLAFGTANAEKLRILANGNVGIGTSSTSYKLDMRNTSADTSARVYRTGTGASDVAISAQNGVGYIGSIANNTPLAFLINNSERMRLDTSGNLGVGAASPSARLHISGAVDANGTFTAIANTAAVIASTGNQQLRFFVDETNKSVALQSSEAGVSNIHDLLLNPAGGNVGIGTTSATQKLDVNGAIKATSFIGPVIAASAANSGGYTINSDSDSAGSDGGVNIRVRGSTKLAVTDSGRVAVGAVATPVSLLANTSTNTNDQAGSGSSADSLSWLTNAAGYVASFVNSSTASNANGVLIKTTGTASTNRILNLNANGSDVMTVGGDGRLGLGTTLPSDQLQIGSAMAFHNSGHKVIGFGYAPGTTKALMAGNPAELRWDPTGGLSMGVDATTRAANDTVAVPANQLYLKSNGRIGIGTNTPRTSLEVIGGIRAVPGAPANDNANAGYSFGANGDTGLFMVNNTGSADGDLAFYSNAQQKITMLSGGNLGIGTTTPSSRLHVLETAPAAAFATQSNIAPILTADTSSNYYAAYNFVTANSAFNFNNGMYGALNRTVVSPGNTGTISTVVGGQSDVILNQTATSATTTSAYGSFSSLTANSGATTSGGYAAGFIVGNSGTGTLVDAAGLRVLPPTNTGTGSIGTYYGLHISTPTAAGTNYAIYSQGGNNYFGGKVGLGTTNPGGKLHVHAASGSYPWIIGTNSDYAVSSSGSGFRLSTGAASGDTYSELQAFRGGYTAGTVLALNPWQGNVGVGTTTPSARFGVYRDWGGGNSSSSDAVIQSSTGNVGDGNYHAFSHKHGAGETFYVTGMGNMYINGTLTQASDRRLKTDIEPIEDALEKISKLSGMTYRWKDPQKDHGRQLGLIAQEVEAVFPEAVHTNKLGWKSVAYQNLVSPIINAVNELHSRLFKVDERVSTMERELASLKADKAKLQDKVKSLEANEASTRAWICSQDKKPAFCH